MTDKEEICFRTDKEEIYDLRLMLLRMVTQHCAAPPEYKSFDIDSGFMPCNANAIRYLCNLGMMEMVNDGTAYWVKAKRIDTPDAARKARELSGLK